MTPVVNSRPPSQSSVMRPPTRSGSRPNTQDSQRDTASKIYLNFWFSTKKYYLVIYEHAHSN